MVKNYSFEGFKEDGVFMRAFRLACDRIIMGTRSRKDEEQAKEQIKYLEHLVEWINHPNVTPAPGVTFELAQKLGVSWALVGGIKNKSPMEQVYSLAYARGFLVEWQDNGIVMSDNAFCPDQSSDEPSDWDYLRYVTKGMVNIENDRIISCTDEFSTEELYERLFEQRSKIESDEVSFDCKSSFEFFKKSEFPAKVSTYRLEPFVAMYVKALSSIKIHTITSCQGHDSHRTVKIELAGKCHACFHDAIWAVDSGLHKAINNEWNTPPVYDTTKPGHWSPFWKEDTQEDYTRPRVPIRLTFHQDYEGRCYFRLIRAGHYLYENRVRFRSWRERIVNEISSMDADLDKKHLTQVMVDILKPLAADISPE